MGRISRTELYMRIAGDMAERGTCERLQVGCIITLGGRIVGSGYCGSPAGTPHCLDEGCITDATGSCVRTSHAEMGAIAWAARKGIALEGATMWCTDSPCYTCAKAIINAGICRFVYARPYRLTEGLDLLRSAGVEVERYVPVGPDMNQMELC